MKVYIVAEYPHGHEDEIHRIVLVTQDIDEAKKAVGRQDYKYFIEEYWVEAA